MYKRLFIPDTHTPFHDKKAFALMLDVAKDFKPDEIVYLGDFFDVLCLSRFGNSADPHKAYSLLTEELREGQCVLREVEKTIKAKRFVFIEGNHEARVTKYLTQWAPKLLGSVSSTRDILGIPSSYKYLPYGQQNFYKIGKDLVVCHGTVTNKYATHASLAKYKSSVIFGHTHRLSEVHMRTIHGEHWRGYNCGWLGDMKHAAEYITDLADWTHGFALGTWMKSGKWHIELISIVNNSCSFGGKIYGKS